MSKENYLPPGERDDILKQVEANKADIEAARQANSHQQLLEKLETCLYLQQRLYSEAAPEVLRARHQLCEACNAAGTSLLADGNLKGAHTLLKRAEEVARDQRQKAITSNNMACYYRRTGKLRTAATLLERALEIEEYNEPEAAAQTHLNLCATLSQLGRHADALYHAQSAMIRVYEILSPKMIAGQSNQDDFYTQVTVLCIAYHNTAVEHEYLKNYDGAVCAYCEGGRWASQFLGADHQLILILKDSVTALKGKLKPNSGAFKRVEEFLSGSGQNGAGKAGAGDSQMGLLTPRNEAVVAEGDTGIPGPEG